MKILNVKVRRAYADGRHNAFTDIVHFRDAYYLVFRSGSFHCSRDGHVLVIRSRDFVNWEPVADLSQPDRDSRDPQFMVLDDRLVVVGYVTDKRYGRIFEHQSVYSVTSDGVSWSGWTPFLEKHTHLWSVKKHGEHYYAGIYWNTDDPADWKAGLARSSDGFEWETVSIICDRDTPDETAIEFLADETCVALVRRARRSSLIASAPPPYRQWTVTDAGVNVGGPVIARIGDQLLLGGRMEIQAAMVQKGAVTEENNAGVHVTATVELDADGVRNPFILRASATRATRGSCTWAASTGPCPTTPRTRTKWAPTRRAASTWRRSRSSLEGPDARNGDRHEDSPEWPNGVQ